MHANPGDDLRDQLLVVTHVRHHRETRLDLVEHVADGVMGLCAWSMVVLTMMGGMPNFIAWRLAVSG